MTYPTKYSRQYDFQSYQVSNPTRPLPGNRVNVDLNAVVTSIDEVVEFLKTSIRADGRLANGSVGVNQLDATFDLGFSLPTTWEAGVAYTTDSTVFHDNKFYKANVAHNSTDGFDESKWDLIVDFGEQATAAAASATAALASETAAAGSATTATTQASNAADSATAASNSATAASGSATTATTQATAASNSATAASTSATNAAASATAADASADAAAASAASITIASQAEAEAGTENTKLMTPLRTAEAIAALGGSIEFIQDGTGAVTRTMQDKARDVVDLRDFASVFDGVVDNTTAFTNALTQATAAGAWLRLPQGIVRLTSTVVVPRNAKVIGSGMAAVYSVGTAFNPLAAGQGTWIFLDHTGVGLHIDDSAETETKGAREFRDFGTYRNQPDPSGGGAFTPNDHNWDFAVFATTEVFFDSIMLLNATRGIFVGLSGSGTLTSAGRVSFNRIYGQPLKNGIKIDYSYDCCRLHHIHFWPFWWQGANVMDYTTANAKAIEFGRCDNPLGDQIFSFAYYIGLNFIAVPTVGSATGGFTQNFSFGGVQSDFCGVGFNVEVGADGTSGHISDMVIVAKTWSPYVAFPAFRIAANTTDIRFGSLKVSNSQQQNIFVGGTGNRLRVNSLTTQLCNASGSGYNHAAIANGNIFAIGMRPSVDSSGTFRSSTGTIDGIAGSGRASVTTDASGIATVTHGLGFAPTRVAVAFADSANWFISPWGTPTSTTFQIRAVDNTNAALASTALNLDWSAYA